MLIIIEATLLILVGFVYLIRETKRKIKNYRTGDIIWVREKLFRPQKAVLCNWDDFTFNYILEDSYELKVKSWLFLARNDSYQERKQNPDYS